MNGLAKPISLDIGKTLVGIESWATPTSGYIAEDDNSGDGANSQPSSLGQA